jgi:excisionase family DNA binding protein
MRTLTSARGRMLTTTQAATALGVHERTLRRYLSMGLLAHRRLPGGHYRIPEAALAEFWQASEKPAVRPARAERTREQPGRDSERRRRPRSSGRRAPLGEDDSPASYDLSTESLSALRSRLS